MIDLWLILLVNGVVFGAIYGINAIGIGIVYNTTGIINFAHGEFAMLGGMLAYALQAQGLPLPVAILGAVLGAMAVGVLVERIAIRPLWQRGAKGWTFVFMLFAVSIIIANVTMNSIGPDPYTLDSFGAIPSTEFFGVRLTSQALWVLICAMAMMLALHGFFNQTTLGKAMKATAVNPRAAGWMGIPVGTMMTLSFVLAAGLAAIGGAVVAPLIGTAFDIGLPLTLKGFAAAIIGGLGNIRGAMIGGIILGIVEAICTAFVSSTYSDVTTYSVMIAILVLWPSGLFRPLVELRREEV